MAYASVSYPTNGVDNLFAVPFEYISRTHVKVYLSGVSVPFTWVTAQSVALNLVPSAGLIVTITRHTPVNARLVDFTDGVILTEATLDKDANQSHFLIQEMRDDITNIEAGMLGQSTIDQIISDASDSAFNQVVTHPDWGSITITRSGTAPSNPGEGDIWYNSSDNDKSYQWDGTQWQPLFVQVNGSLIVDGTIVGSKIQASAITASHISVGNLSALAADIGNVRIQSGMLVANYTGTGTRTEYGDDGTYILWAGEGAKNDANAKFYIKADGTAVFKGSLSAATGTFAGSLSAASGTFAGSLTATAVNAVDTVNIRGQAITIPVGYYSSVEVALNDPAVTIATAALDAGSGAAKCNSVSIMFSGVMKLRTTNEGTFGYQLHLFRNGVKINEVRLNITSWSSVGTNHYSPAVLGFMDSAPSDGVNTYEIKGYENESGLIATAQDRHLLLLGAKR